MTENKTSYNYGRGCLAAGLIFAIWGGTLADINLIRHLEGAAVWPDFFLATILTFAILSGAQPSNSGENL